MSGGHTAGPWGHTEYGYERHAIADQRGTEIGFIHRRRDARLIAAAPDLFQAVMACWALLETDGRYADSECKQLAADAIAKALGQ